MKSPIIKQLKYLNTYAAKSEIVANCWILFIFIVSKALRPIRYII